MNTTNIWGHYATFNSIFVFLDIVEQDLKKCRIFCFVWKLHLKSIFVFWDILERDLEKSLNFCLV